MGKNFGSGKQAKPDALIDDRGVLEHNASIGTRTFSLVTDLELVDMNMEGTISDDDVTCGVSVQKTTSTTSYQ
jgi:hypothetical protein